MRRERERWDGVGREGQGRKKGAPGKEERRVGEGRWEREGGGVGGAGREGGREEEHGHLNPTAAAGRTELGGGGVGTEAQADSATPQPPGAWLPLCPPPGAGEDGGRSESPWPFWSVLLGLRRCLS